MYTPVAQETRRWRGSSAARRRCHCGRGLAGEEGASSARRSRREAPCLALAARRCRRCRAGRVWVWSPAAGQTQNEEGGRGGRSSAARRASRIFSSFSSIPIRPPPPGASGAVAGPAEPAAASERAPAAPLDSMAEAEAMPDSRMSPAKQPRGAIAARCVATLEPSETKEHHWAGLRPYTRRLHRGTERVRIEERLCVGEQGGEGWLAARPAVAAVVWDHQVGAEPVEAGGEGVVVRADLAVAYAQADPRLTSGDLARRPPLGRRCRGSRGGAARSGGATGAARPGSRV